MADNNDIGPVNRNGSHYLRVGDLARQTGKTVRAIHLYEEMGLLEPATRSSGGFRLYHPEAIERVRWIDLLHGLGISLQETREALERWWQSDRGPEAMAELRALFTAKLDETRENIRRQQQLEKELVGRSAPPRGRARAGAGCGFQGRAGRRPPDPAPGAGPRRRAFRTIDTKRARPRGRLKGPGERSPEADR